jgi:hypothetical protein
VSRGGVKSAAAKSAAAKTTAAKTTGTKTAVAKTSAAAKPATAKSAGAKSTGSKSTGAKSTGSTGGRPPAGRPGGRGGGGSRPPISPVRVGKDRPWGAIILFTVVGLVAAGIIGFGAYEVHQNGLGWQSKADKISGIVDYRKTDAAMLTRNHQYGTLKYTVLPPVGGNHNPNWMQCNGHVYDAQIPNENAVHSLEHGAVWVTYRPDLPAAEVAALKAKVTGNDFMLMSPYPGLDAPISLQAWGFQLKVQNASDKRIGEFITDLRQNAAMEPNTPCSTGSYVTGTGSTPFDLGSPAASTPVSAGTSASAPAATGTSGSPAAK